jgi:glycosyltransferase involved in cell wall biosynthesis
VKIIVNNKLRVGIAINETWNFFNEIYADMQRHYQTSLFQRRTWRLPVFNARINRHLFYRDLRSFMAANDVVFFEWASELLVAATHQPKTCGVITRLHRYEMYNWVNRINWEAVDKIILVSQAKQRELIARFPELSGKTVVISPSTSLEKFVPQPKVYNGDIGILCYLTPRKRVYDLILTFYELTKRSDDFHLHIAGGMDPANEDYYGALLNIVNELNLQTRVTFYGNVTDPWNWYRNIDIFISNSYSEGLQVAPMEAMSCGCYTLAHHWAGAEELLPAENLFYTNEEMIEKISHYKNLSTGERQTQVEKMRQLACANFDIEETKKQIMEVIDVVGVTYQC